MPRRAPPTRAPVAPRPVAGPPTNNSNLLGIVAGAERGPWGEFAQRPASAPVPLLARPPRRSPLAPIHNLGWHLGRRFGGATAAWMLPTAACGEADALSAAPAAAPTSCCWGAHGCLEQAALCGATAVEQGQQAACGTGAWSLANPIPAGACFPPAGSSHPLRASPLRGGMVGVHPGWWIPAATDGCPMRALYWVLHLPAPSPGCRPPAALRGGAGGRSALSGASAGVPRAAAPQPLHAGPMRRATAHTIWKRVLAAALGAWGSGAA